MSAQVWIVMGRTGEYEDRCDWLVRAFSIAREAEDFAAVANDWLRENSMHEDDRGALNDARYDDATFKPPFDPKFRCDYTGTAYFVAEPVALDAGRAALRGDQ